MEIINTLNHSVIISTREGEVTFPPSPAPVNVCQTFKFSSLINGIPITRATVKEVQNLPREMGGRLYIVSPKVKSLYPDRQDFVVTGKPIKQDGVRVAFQGLVI